MFAPYYQPGFVSAIDYGVFTGVAMALSAVLVLLVIARLRPVIIAGSGRQQKTMRSSASRTQAHLSFVAEPHARRQPRHVARVASRSAVETRAASLGRLAPHLLELVAWGTYKSITDGEGQPGRSMSSGYVLMLMFGMLMLSATAPTALAEERVRGSLDVLLATPLSTRSIVIAKWWGIYRSVLFLALMPLYVAVFLACSVLDIPPWAMNIRFGRPLVPLTIWDRCLAVCFSLADFLASGAMIVSLGLALATWVRRLGRAVALSVIAFFLVGLGWVFLVEILFRQFTNVQTVDWIEKYGWLRDCASSISPIGGPMRPIEMLLGIEFHRRRLIWLGTGVVILIKAVIAGLLLWLTIKTFDRCLGRVPESRSSALLPTPRVSAKGAQRISLDHVTLPES